MCIASREECYKTNNSNNNKKNMQKMKSVTQQRQCGAAVKLIVTTLLLLTITVINVNAGPAKQPYGDTVQVSAHTHTITYT